MYYIYRHYSTPVKAGVCDFRKKGDRVSRTTNRLYAKLINKDKLPQHIAIIMDGNGQLGSKARFMPRTFGHRSGMNSLKQVVETCCELGA